ncbi:hypothetical protein AAHA92_00467 [Salvia divinorum]|uniref:SWIM-type domain-containing protein n=1 Tax=Salvia divinorum TaxID=28513 RepID=A0ABD1IM36_SALDI
MDKGKGRADDNNMDQSSFVDSDYDLSDKEEDNIMAAQVERWKNVVDSMRTIGDGDGDDGGTGDDLPSDSPSTRTESDDDLGDRDSEVVKIVSRRYKASTDLNDPKWEVGLWFNSKQDFTELVQHQGVKIGKKLRLKKNDKIRCVAYCRRVLRSKKNRPGYPWMVTLAYRSGLGCWQISRLRDTHKCGGASYNHGCANAKYLSRLFKEDMRVFPGMTVGQFIEKVHGKMKITISSGKAKRAMARARKLIEGDLIKQYKRLHDYKTEILRANPRSTIVLATQRLEDGYDKFKAIYIAYEACKTSFKRHCMRITGLDGCHLKGQASGILLAAIGLDLNDQIFPNAFAVVRIENTDTWSWFLRLLVLDLEIKDSSNWTFISDRQKGLINVVRVAARMPCTELKDKIWEAARATNTYGFEKAMEELKGLNEAAYKWLTAHTKKESWSRAFFGFEAKCDILVNNISEYYNRVLLFAREKPLYGMLECIRMYLMDRFTSRRKMGAWMEDCIGPKIRKKLEKLKEKIGECMAGEAGEWIYQVNTKFNEQFVVDLRDRTCSCRHWILTGILCQHAIAAIEMTGIGY